jgi:phosphohistidine phosphatase
MKKLILLRHAKSEWNSTTARDFDRPLNARGREAARAMGQEMRRLELAIDQVIASPAARVVETISGASEVFGPLAPAYDEDVYLALAETLLGIVRAVDESAGSLLIVGHNPGMERLTLLLSAPSALRDEVAVKYPTGALALIELPVARWCDVAEGGGTLSRFIRPRDLDPALGPDPHED